MDRPRNLASIPLGVVQTPQTKHEDRDLAIQKSETEEGKIKMAFIAGPYIGDGSYVEIYRNIGEAERVAVHLANRGVFFFCPHTHTSFFGRKAKAPESFYKAMNFRFLSFCDFLIATPRWEKSDGARKVIEQCILERKLVFVLNSLDDAETYDEIEAYAKSGKS